MKPWRRQQQGKDNSLLGNQGKWFGIVPGSIDPSWRTRSTIHPHLMLSPTLPATGAKPRGSKKGRTWCRSAANDQLTLVIKNELLGYSETQLDTAIGKQQASKEVEAVSTSPQNGWVYLQHSLCGTGGVKMVVVRKQLQSYA